MHTRAVAVLFVAFALLFPSVMATAATSGTLAGSSPLAATAGGSVITGPLQILPHPTAGLPNLFHLRDLLAGQSVDAMPASLDVDPSPLKGPTGPTHDALRWLKAHAVPRDAVRTSHLVGPGIAAVITGPVTIDQNLVVDTSVTYDNATLTFTTPALGHRTLSVTGAGSLTIKNSVVKNDDGDRLHYGLISALGGLELSNDQFQQMVVDSVHDRDKDKAGGDQPVQHISSNTFQNTPYGVLTDRDNVTISGNTFYGDEVGVEVVDAGTPVDSNGNCTYCPPFPYAMNPLVQNNTFEENQVGIQVYSDQDTGDAEGDPIGHYEYNTIRANLIGIQVYSAGWTDPNDSSHIVHANFTYNNVYSNWGDAVNDLRGITITVPGVGTISVSDSAAEFDNNFFSDDSKFESSHDKDTNDRGSEVANSAPALPAAPMVVSSGNAVWNKANPAPTITGPVFVTGKLSIDNITLSSQFTIGAKKGGNLLLDNVTVSNGNGIVQRNDKDLTKDSTFTGTRLFDMVTIFRNNGTATGNTVTGASRDRATAFELFSGQFTDDFTWTPTVSSNTVTNTRYGVFGATDTVTLSHNVFRHIGAVKYNFFGNFFSAALADGGALGVITTYNSDHNTFEDTGSAFWMNVGTVASSNDVFDGNFAGYNSDELSTLTFTTDVFSANEFGIINALETSDSVTSSNFTYNGVGIWNALNAVTATGSNFYNNYLASLDPYTTVLSGVTKTEQDTCTTCWSPADESYLQVDGSSVVYTSTVGNAPNSVPSPSWAAHATEAVGTTVDLPAGALQGPVVARQGGEVRVTGVTVDAGGKFPIGAKGGGQSGGTTGKLTMNGVTLLNPGFLGLNSSSSTIRNSIFKGYIGEGELFDTIWNSPTFECNQVNLNRGTAGRVLETPAGNAPVFRRNLFNFTDDLDVGVVAFGTTFAGDPFHNASVVYENNSMLHGTGLGAIASTTNGTPTIDGNNFFDTFDGSHLALYRLVQNATTDGTSEVPGVLTATNNWGGPTAFFDGTNNGPRVQWQSASGKAVQLLNNGTGLRIYDRGWPPPTWSPYSASANAFTPCIGFTFSPASPTEVQSVSFDSSLSFDPSGFPMASYAWDFNGEGTSALPNPTFQFADEGAKSVKLTVTTQGGLSASLSKTVTVSGVPPTASFTASVVNETQPVQFTDASSAPNPNDSITSWSWDFGDGNTSTQQSPSHKFAEGGTKSVKLTATDDGGFSASATKSVAIPQVGPVAAFTWTGSLENQTFQLTDASTHPNGPPTGTDKVTGWSWSCSDGFASTAQNPSHKFADEGTYTCSLKATDGDGLSDTASHDIPVQAVPPAAKFTESFTNETQPVQFTDQSTHPNAPTDSVTGWSWDFNGEGSSTLQNPSFRFHNGGAKTVTLTVTADDGLTDKASATFTLPDVAPVAGFAYSPAVPNPGDTVQFNDSSTHPNAYDSIVAWSWDFGDGNASALQDPTHAFSLQGAYNVTLTVTDGDGLTGSITKRVAVGNVPPVASWNFTPSQPTDVDTVQFTTDSYDPDGNITGYAWSFGDGNTSSDANTTHQFADEGTYAVTLTVTDNLGGTTSLTKSIVVTNVAPTPDFAYQPDHPQVNDTVYFYDRSSDPDGTVASWHWDFGDGSSADGYNPTHVYGHGGNYNVTLLIADDDGAVAQVTKVVHVCETHISLDLNNPGLEICIKLPP